MGTWAIHSFGNDDAGDFLGTVTDQRNLEPVRGAIARVLDAGGYLEAPDAQQCLAACEVIAAALGHLGPAAEGEPDLVAWITRVKPAPDSALIFQAVRAIDRILASNSELRELWEESEEYSEWQAAVTNLRARVQA
jgi:hypothetical protein